MIVSAGIATTAFARALTEEKVERLFEAWNERPESDPLMRVEDLVREISQGVFWAGLLNDIHQAIWRLYFEEDLRRVDTGAISVKECRALLAELKALTIDEGWWFVFDLDETRLGYSVARQVPLAEWEARRPESLQRPFPAWVEGL